MVRNYLRGTANYHTSTHTGFGFAAIHDHSLTPVTLGMGEVTAVLNGVHFRTSHNDYDIRRPSNSSKAWLETEPIPPPPVPESVLNMTTVQDQIAEMRQYFLAFQTQNSSLRDYRPFFKPVLCYLEGTWLVNATTAANMDNNEKARTEAYLGSVTATNQPVSSLPTTIIGVDDVTNEPILAQWMYRTLCYPTDDIPTSYFLKVDELAYRYPRNLSLTATSTTRGSHFVLDDKLTEGYRGYSFLDRLVAKIPGLDNTPGILKEKELGLRDVKFADYSGVLNLGYYNRQYADYYDAMGKTIINRGFSDANMFVALTTQPQVAPLLLSQCTSPMKCVTKRRDIKASWMMPLEIVYLTPLLRWNPYAIPFGSPQSVLTASGRTGQTSTNALNGSNEQSFTWTPAEFFTTPTPENPDAADTNPAFKWVMDGQNQTFLMAPSGTRIVLPAIAGVGSVRLRYPIAPIHGEGSSVWKELNALKSHLAMQISKLSQAFN
ncbi:unnamed protein product [Lymnaea stagnalis]|uniref:Uncharacterized protein n=1 Tax=Lymnaea stagnalis TaxID=6523 RepID=A0AAV2ILX6_LYMST